MAMNSAIKIIGLVGAVSTTVAMLPQAIRIIRLKETRDISLSTFVILAFGVTCWFVYGIHSKDVPLILANSITLPIDLVIVFLKLKYK